MACAPFFVSVVVGIFFKNEKLGVNSSGSVRSRRVYISIYVSLVVTVVLAVVILHEKMTFVSVAGALLILLGLIVSQKKVNQKK